MSDIVITGLGAVSPIGIGIDAFWQAVKEEKCGIDEIAQFDTSNLPIHHAAEIQDFNARDFLPTRLVMDLEPYMQYAYVAAEEAIKQSGLDTESSRVGVVMGSALCGISAISSTQSLYEQGKSAGPKFLLKAMGNIAAAQLEINHHITGPSLTVSTACSSGGDALFIAKMLIESNAADAMIVMAGEAAICPTLIQSLNKTRALSKTGESKPFDVNRNGFVLGEGGSALVIERSQHALKRDAQILADLCSCANNNDAFNPTSPEPDGLGAATCITQALQSAQLLPSQIGYINTHGTATSAGDKAEAQAINNVFSNDAMPLIGSTKGMTGHMMGAGGLLETIVCINAINDSFVPTNVGCKDVDTNLKLNIVTSGNNQHKINFALSNAMGFGGQNSCIIVGKHKEQ